jgi:molybdate transport system substrate-binding protein
MPPLNILSAGAAQAVVQGVIAEFERDTGHAVHAEFGAVGTMKARLLSGRPVDVIVLTAPLIEELIASGHLVKDSRADLGRVSTGVAVRAGTPLPNVSDRAALRGNLLAATAVAFPDPAVATAGKIVIRMLEQLGIAAELAARTRYFPNGNAAMNWLAASSGLNELGITQITEIVPIRGVALVGALPEEFQARATYSVGLATRAPSAGPARDFIARLTSPMRRPALAAAGFEVGN